MQVAAVRISKYKTGDSTDLGKSCFELTAIELTAIACSSRNIAVGNNLDQIRSSWDSTAISICGISLPYRVEKRLEILDPSKHYRSLPVSWAAVSSSSPFITFAKPGCVRPVLSSRKHELRRIVDAS
jgi:hypothetical protein